MIIKYKFATGEITEVKVSDEIGVVITASRKAEHALVEHNRYHCFSLDAIDYSLFTVRKPVEPRSLTGMCLCG